MWNDNDTKIQTILLLIAGCIPLQASSQLRVMFHTPGGNWVQRLALHEKPLAGTTYSFETCTSLYVAKVCSV